ncbi:MAG: hypothetical protein AAF414_02995 [Pseudomonadota bacterium]
MTRTPTVLTGLALTAMLSINGSAVAQDTPEDVSAACAAASNLPAAVCDCVGEDSTDLTGDQRAFYVAALEGNDAETARLRGAMSVDEIAGIATFMRVAPANCVQ